MTNAIDYAPNPIVPLFPLHMMKPHMMVSGGGALRKRLGHEGRALRELVPS